MGAVFLDERADLHEGHGFSRAVDGMKAGRLRLLRYGLLQGSLCVDLSIGEDVPQGLKPSMAAAFTARLNPCPSLRFFANRFSRRGMRTRKCALSIQAAVNVSAVVPTGE